MWPPGCFDTNPVVSQAWLVGPTVTWSHQGTSIPICCPSNSHFRFWSSQVCCLFVEIHVSYLNQFESLVWIPSFHHMFFKGWSNSSCTSAPCNVQRPGRFQFWSLTRQAPRSAPRGRDSSGTGGPNEFCSFGVLLPHFVTTLPIKDGGATFSVCESEDDDSFNSVLFGALLELLKPIIYICMYLLQA